MGSKKHAQLLPVWPSSHPCCEAAAPKSTAEVTFSEQSTPQRVSFVEDSLVGWPDPREVALKHAERNGGSCGRQEGFFSTLLLISNRIRILTDHAEQRKGCLEFLVRRTQHTLHHSFTQVDVMCTDQQRS